jgi:acyl carrier protein
VEDQVAPQLEHVYGRLRELLGDSLTLTPDTALVSSGVLDSFHLLEVVEWLEERYEIVALASDVNTETLDTPAKIVAYVRSKQA